MAALPSMIPGYLWQAWKPRLSGYATWPQLLKAVSASRYELSSWAEGKTSWSDACRAVAKAL